MAERKRGGPAGEVTNMTVTGRGPTVYFFFTGEADLVESPSSEKGAEMDCPDSVVERYPRK
jgi:hypothetical protein